MTLPKSCKVAVIKLSTVAEKCELFFPQVTASYTLHYTDYSHLKWQIKAKANPVTVQAGFDTFRSTRWRTSEVAKIIYGIVYFLSSTVCDCVCCWSLLVIDTNSWAQTGMTDLGIGVDKAPLGFDLRKRGSVRGPAVIWNTKICCRFRSSDRRKCFDSILWTMGVTSLIVTGGRLPVPRGEGTSIMCAASS
jgi:hypothetical protein